MRVFKSVEDATKVANLVIKKFRQNSNMLPSVELVELAQLGVIDLSMLYVEPYQNASGGWGFHIMLDQISTMTYEWLPGFDQGLPNEEAAIKVGTYVIQRIQQEFQYPAMDASDMKKSGIN
jgi:hypothetical protein